MLLQSLNILKINLCTALKHSNTLIICVACITNRYYNNLHSVHYLVKKDKSKGKKWSIKDKTTILNKAFKLNILNLLSLNKYKENKQNMLDTCAWWVSKVWFLLICLPTNLGYILVLEKVMKTWLPWCHVTCVIQIFCQITKKWKMYSYVWCLMYLYLSYINVV